ncbi:MAG: LuxR C-terminal-related transcriptional regulator [Streptomyces sp.]
MSKAHDMTVTAVSWSNGLRMTRSAPVDVCIAGSDGPRDSALHELVATLRSRDGKGLLALTGTDRPGALRRALDARALGFLDHHATPERLLTAIRQVARGKRFVDDSLALALIHASEMPLTQRELAVLTVAAEGATVAEIAHKLSLAGGTVRNYMSAITRKTGARNRIDAIRISQGAGWL